MEDPTALFHQYETDYCNKSTDISRKITSVGALAGGKARYLALYTRMMHLTRRECLHEAPPLLSVDPCTKPVAGDPLAELRRKKVAEIEAVVREADSVVSNRNRVASLARQQSTAMQLPQVGFRTVDTVGRSGLPLPPLFFGWSLSNVLLSSPGPDCVSV